MVQLRMKVCNIQKIKLGKKKPCFEISERVSGGREKGRKPAVMSVHAGLFVMLTFVLEGKLERKLSAIELAKQESFEKPRTEGQFVYEFFFHQVPWPSNQQRNYETILFCVFQIHNEKILHTHDTKGKIEMFLSEEHLEPNEKKNFLFPSSVMQFYTIAWFWCAQRGKKRVIV